MRPIAILLSASLAAGLMAASTTRAGEGITIETLPSGATLILEPRQRFDTFALTLFAHGGALEDPDDAAGLTTVLSRLLMRGSRSKTADAFALAVESVGATVTPFSGMLGFGLQAEGPSRSLASVFDAMSDALLTPRLSPDDLAREMALARQSLLTSLAAPGVRRMRAAQPFLFPGHPLGRVHDPGAYPGRITPMLVRKTHASRVTGKRLIVVVVGGFDPEAVREDATRLMASLAPGDSPRAPLASPSPLPRIIRVRARTRSSQAEVMVAVPTSGIEAHEEAALDILEHLLAGFEERLSRHIRGERGWAYWLESVDWRYPQAGLFGIATAVPRRRLKETEEVILEEWRRIVRQPPNEQEMARARLWLATDAARRWQKASARASTLAARAARGHPPEPPATYASRLAAVTPKEVRELASRLLAGSAPVIVRAY